MNTNATQRIQTFLTITDTVHDYCNPSRLEELNDTTRFLLQQSVYHSLQTYFIRALEREMAVLADDADPSIIEEIKKIYKDIYARFDGPNFPSKFEDDVVVIVKQFVSSRNPMVLQPLSHTIPNTRPESRTELYKLCQDMCGVPYIRYILDKNSTKNDIFCMNPRDIKELTGKTDKSVQRGLFHTYEYQVRGNYDRRTQGHKLMSAFFGMEYPQTGGNNPCVENRDICDYELTKEDNELLLFEKLYVSQKKGTYLLRHRITGSENKIISFDTLKTEDDQGLTLFANAALNLFAASRLGMGINWHITRVEKCARDAVKSVFLVACDRFKSEDDFSADDFKHSENYIPVYLTAEEYIYAMYDLKRAMDYLPVKACANANAKFRASGRAFVYVSQDRLALAYAHIHGCPCIQTHQDGKVSLFRGVRDETGTYTVGGMNPLTKSVRATPPLRFPMKFRTKTKKNTSFADTPLYFSEIIDETQKSTMKDPMFDPVSYNFNGFLKAYRDVSGKDSITFFYYVLFRTLYEFVA